MQLIKKTLRVHNNKGRYLELKGEKKSSNMQNSVHSMVSMSLLSLGIGKALGIKTSKMLKVVCVRVCDSFLLCNLLCILDISLKNKSCF